MKKVLLGIVILGLIVSNVTLLYRVHQLEKRAQEAGEIISGLEDRHHDLASRVYENENRFAAVVEKNPQMAFTLIDNNLDLVEAGREVRFIGSYSDSFLPMLEAARRAGASMEDVNKRLDRVLALAQAGKYYSSAVKMMMESSEFDAEIAGEKVRLAAIR